MKSKFVCQKVRSNMSNNVVIIGAGQAGLTAAMSLRDNGWTGGIHLIGAEEHIPYQRPPLSKGYLAGTESNSDLALGTAKTLADQNIVTHFGTEATAIDREQHLVTLEDGVEVPYRWLIFATGSQPRRLDIPGSDLAGIYAVRTIDDADALRKSFAEKGPTVFIGGGFLNLEVAVQAVEHGPVTVLEVAPQILGRVLSRPAADALAEYHESLGVDIRCGVSIERILEDNGKVAGVELDDGQRVAAKRIVLSVGAAARDELATQAGLETAGGIVVDEYLRTSDPAIFAIGDCAVFPSAFAGTQMRVESVQNATDQARHVAGLITKTIDEAYRALPWFWSSQGGRRLQIAGLASPDDEARVVSEDKEKGKLVVERYRGDQLVAVETINAPGPHMKARRSLTAPAPELLEASV